MAKMTVSSIRAQIASLEAKAMRLAQVESKASVAKVRALMTELGVTFEHLGAKVSGTAKAVLSKATPAKKASAKKTPAKRAGAGKPKYADPKTGRTWTGFGRAPTWLASVKNREHYLVEKLAEAATPAPAGAAARKTPKKGAAKSAKAAKTVKAAAKKVTRSAKPAAGKKTASRKQAAAAPASKKTALRKRAAKKVANKTPSSAAAPSTGADTQ